jgi:hypothetical protein
MMSSKIRLINKDVRLLTELLRCSNDDLAQVTLALLTAEH